MIGQMVSHYKIIEKIGEGGMGVVYKAKDTKLKRAIAIKFLPPHLTRDKYAKERFIHEAQAASALEHSNICNIHEIDETKDGQTFIVMACYEGEILKHKIERGPLKLDEAVDIAFQISQGIGKAHEKGIVHRDIKPANVFLTKDRIVKILDFGLAKLSGASKITKEGITLGTVAYMSPEQSRGEDVDFRTDIWSLGVVLYEMLTGELPFKGDYEQSVIYSILNDEPTPAAELRDDIPDSLAKVLERTQQKEATARYHETKDLIAELSKVRAELISHIPRVKDKKIPSIAVMPFVNMSNDPEQEYFCDGISEELLNGLAHLENLKVAARTSAFSFKSKDLDIVEIGKKLNVNTVLEGSVRKSGNRLRITAQLINVADGFHLWSERYDRQIDDIFDIQDEISHSIVDTLKVKLYGDEQDSLYKRGAENQEAYQMYLNGRYHRNKTTPEGYFTAIEYFKRAIMVDPDYAEAYAGMAFTYFYLYNYSILPPEKCIPQFTKAIEKTLELDNSDAEGHLAKGSLNFWYRWNFKEAEIAYRRSISLNPNHAEAHTHLGMFFGMMGKRQEALAHAEKAMELDPFTAVPTLAYIGWTYFLTGDFDLLDRIAKKILELDSPWFGHAFLGFKYWMAEKYKDAVPEFELSTRAQLPLTYAWLGCVLGIMGEKEKALGIINKLRELSKYQHIGAYNMGLIYLGMGENDKAFEWFNIGCDKEHDGILLFLRQKFKVLPGLKKDARMDALVKKFGLPGD